MPLTPNTTILNGKYRILRLIGEGGMARVWLAEEVHFGRQVAIKEPHAGLGSTDSKELRQRFQREVKVSAALAKAKAPNIVQALTAEPYEDSLLLVLAYMPGGDLETLLEQHPNGLPIERVLAIAEDILAALAAVHNHKLEIVHRDIKPSNILFDGDGRAHLADFGLAQVAGWSAGRSQMQAGGHPGTVLYMAPEQSTETGYLTAAADIFAFGCVQFEMLTGRKYKKYKPGTRVVSLRPDTPRWLEDLQVMALAEDRWQRPRDGRVMHRAWMEQLQAERRRQKEEEVRRRREAEEEERRLRTQAEDAERRRQREAETARRRREAEEKEQRLRAQAEEAERRHQEEEAATKRRREADLEKRYKALKTTMENKGWRAAIRLAEEILVLEPGYLDVEGLKSQAQRELFAGHHLDDLQKPQKSTETQSGVIERNQERKGFSRSTIPDQVKGSSAIHTSQSLSTSTKPRLHPYVPEAHDQLKKGRISRRQFMVLATLLGCSATAAATAAMTGNLSLLNQPASRPEVMTPTTQAVVQSESQSMTGIKRGGTWTAAMQLQLLDHPARLSWVEGANIVRQTNEYLTETGPDNITRPLLLDRWEASEDVKTLGLTQSREEGG